MANLGDLDPEDEDRREFIDWTLGEIDSFDTKSELYESFNTATATYSAASFSPLVSVSEGDVTPA